MTAAPSAPVTTPCPTCGAGLNGDADEILCRFCGREFHHERFSPRGLQASLGVGAGRCAVHPATDAVDGCGRCGAFVCEVCATPTGGKLFCPACFDQLHARGELESTRSARFRTDYLGLVLGVGGLIMWLPAPFAVLVGVWTLAKSRDEPYLRRGLGILSILFGLLMIGITASVMIAAFKRGS